MERVAAGAASGRLYNGPMPARVIAFLLNSLTFGLKAFGCLMTALSAGLVLFAIFGMNSPHARDGRGMVIFLAMIAALFGLPFLLGSWGTDSGNRPSE